MERSQQRLAPRRAVVSVVLLLLVLGCARRANGQGETTYVLSTSATEEILFLRPYGGIGALVPWYHLYGDGRLVRDIVHQRQQEPIYSHEVRLSSSDIELLFQLIVGSKIPDLTEQRLIEQTGRPLPQAFDASNVVLKLNFASYTRPGDSTNAPFTPRVEMHAPGYLAEVFPQISEIQGFVALVETLDGFFAQPAKQVIFGDLYRAQEGER